MDDQFEPSGPALTRRTALATLGGAGASLLWASGCGPVAAQGPEFTPEMFGARGDGRTDDYEALQRLAGAVNTAGGGTVRFGRNRVYRIDRHLLGARGGANRPRSIAFERCRDLNIDLGGSTIDVKGDFHRAAESERRGRFVVSQAAGLIPLRFIRCNDLSVRNGVLNGNVQAMTRDRGVIESAGIGIELLGCERVVLEDLHVHHFPTDGIQLRIADNGEEICRDVRMDRVRLTNNGRQGMTNAGGAGVVATDCHFSETGHTGGDYGRHGPSAGVDVEPYRNSSVKSDFRALRCRFDDNLGAPVVSGNPHRSGLVELIDCGGRVPAMERMILSPERTVIRGGEWHNIQIGCAFATPRRFTQQITIDVSGGTWSGDDPAWQPVYDLNRRRPHVRIHNNRFRLLSSRPFASNALFLCGNPDHRFEDNEIFVARTGHPGSGAQLIGQFRGAALVRGNRWNTDLEAPPRFVNNYEGVDRVEGESYSGSFGGMGGG